MIIPCHGNPASSQFRGAVASKLPFDTLGSMKAGPAVPLRWPPDRGVDGRAKPKIRMAAICAGKEKRLMHEAAPPFYGLVRRSIPHRSWRRQLRSAIHFVSYHLILKRRTVRVARVNGFRLTVRPTVFHPGYFVTSKFFAAFIETLDLSGKRVADIGTGSGILALA